MAQAKTDPTRIDDHDDLPLRPDWLRLKDVWQQWRDRLGLSQEAAEELEALLRNRETRSAKQQINASGEVTRDILHAEFWRDEARLEVDTDIGGTDHLRVDYPVYVHFDGSAEFLVRAIDVERWERLYPTIAAPPPGPPSSQTASDQQPEDKAGPDPLNAEAAERPSAEQPPQESKAEGRQVRHVKQALQELFPPDGHPPVDMTQKAILKRVNDEFFKLQGWKPASRDSLARAMGLRA